MKHTLIVNNIKQQKKVFIIRIYLDGAWRALDEK